MGATKPCVDCDGQLKLYSDLDESTKRNFVSMLDVWRCLDCGRVEAKFKILSDKNTIIIDQEISINGIERK